MSIDIAHEGHVAVITINRPERRNALDADHYAALSEAWQQVRDDAGIHAAVVTGAGDKAFCAGADIKSFVGRDVPLSEHWLTQKGQLLNRGLEVWKPVICAINGACVGGGMTLMMATDIRVAAQGARLGLAEVKRGIVAANGGTQRIMSQVPYAIAMEMLLLGETIEAEEAAGGALSTVLCPLMMFCQPLWTSPAGSLPTRRWRCRPARNWQSGGRTWTSRPGCGWSRW